jgi:hypothetical protein
LRNPIKKALSLCTLFFLALATPNFAQAPSLAPSDAYYITAKTEFGTETFTIIRDGRQEENFYFVPARPHIAIEKRNGRDYPVFQLLSYQRKKGDALVQGGILQMSIQTGISKSTENELLNTIKSQFPLSDSKKQHRLSPIPMKDAVISMYGFDGKLMDSTPIKEGVAPIFGNQQYPFMLNLTELGSDVMESLTTGQGGLPVLVTYTFQGMTPPGGFKIEVNWDNCYKHLSSDTKLRANVAYASLGANLGADMSKIREELTSNGMMKITALSNEALSSSALDAAMTPVLDLITKELFQNIKAPPQLDPAVAKEIAPPVITNPPAGLVASASSLAAANGIDPTKAATEAVKASGEAAKGVVDAAASAIPYVGTLMKALDVASDIAKNSKVAIGASFALKDAQYVKKGSFVYTYDRQAIVERRTSFGGPIGIGSFDKKIQEACITVLPNGNWAAAYYTLPPVGDPDSLGFKQINLSVTPVLNNKPIPGMKIESAFYKKSDSPAWLDKSGKPVSFFLFPLKAIYDSPEFKSNPANFKFRIKTDVIPLAGQSVSVESYAPMFDGDLAMSPPSELLQLVNVSGECLSMGSEDNEVFMVKGVLKADNLSFPIKLNAACTTQGFLVPKDAKSVRITGLQFLTKKGKRTDWAMNNKNLEDNYPDFDVVLYDSDWQKDLAEDALIGNPEPKKTR